MGGWKKISKPNSRRGVRIVERLEKSENFNSQGSRGGGGAGWLLNCFFLSISNHENYSTKNICVYSKSKIQAKVSKQNLEHFMKMKIAYSSSWAIFIRDSVVSSSSRANFSSFEYLCFFFY